MSLLDLQRAFQDHLVDRGAAVAGQVRGRAEAGLAVYHHAYRAQLVGALREAFEKTWAWLGDDAFEAAALTHIGAHPPQSWTLADYGERFPATLRGLYPDDPEVAELAWLDWALRRAFDGPDAAPPTPQALAEVDWDHAVLRLVPTLRLAEVATNCAAIWSALAAERAPPAAAALPAPAAIRVWRQGLTPRFRSIEAIEHRALVLTQAGAGFGEICQAVGEGLDEEAAASLAGGLLASWLQDELICGFS